MKVAILCRSSSYYTIDTLGKSSLLCQCSLLVFFSPSLLVQKINEKIFRRNLNSLCSKELQKINGKGLLDQPVLLNATGPIQTPQIDVKSEVSMSISPFLSSKGVQISLRFLSPTSGHQLAVHQKPRLARPLIDTTPSSNLREITQNIMQAKIVSSLLQTLQEEGVHPRDKDA